MHVPRKGHSHIFIRLARHSIRNRARTLTCLALDREQTHHHQCTPKREQPSGKFHLWYLVVLTLRVPSRRPKTAAEETAAWSATMPGGGKLLNAWRVPQNEEQDEVLTEREETADPHCRRRE